MEFTCYVSPPRPEESARPFPLHPCLVDPESEVAFLRCVARILLLCLLPQKDAKSYTLRCCLTEVITTKGPFHSSKYGRKKNKRNTCHFNSREASVAKHLLIVCTWCDAPVWELNLTVSTEGRQIYIMVFMSCLVCVSVAAVLKPLVEMLSDPDSINRMLLSQLEKREQQLEQQKKAYTYAASYEDFIKLISTSVDVNFLKQLRWWNIQRNTL